MSAEEESESPSSAPIGPLAPRARRVLGVLIEKALTTPEYYPLTIKALISGCNQKSNRSPIMEFSEEDVEEVLESLLEQPLVARVFPATGRSERWRHLTKDAWSLDRPQRAVIAELLLRGSQTEGEMRSRVARMATIETLEELRGVLEDLRQRGFVVRQSPEGQRRGVIWDHLLYLPKEVAASPRPAPATGPEASATTGIGAADSEIPRADPADLEGRLREIDARIEDLERSLATVRSAQQQLRSALEQHRPATEGDD